METPWKLAVGSIQGHPIGTGMVAGNMAVVETMLSEEVNKARFNLIVTLGKCCVQICSDGEVDVVDVSWMDSVTEIRKKLLIW